MSIKAKITTQPTIIVEVGVKGKQGADGVTFYPNVSENGDLSWTNDGGLSNPKTVNVKGDDGYTPVRGTDYWTEGDIAEIKSYVDEYLDNNPVQIKETDPTVPAWAKKPTPPTPAEIGAAPAYTYGTADIEAGTASPYPEGTLHFIYEPAG